MNIFYKAGVTALLTVCWCCGSNKVQQNPDALTDRVTDNAHILTTAQRDSLIALLEGLEKEVGSQIAILTLPTLEGQKIEELSLRTAEATGLGRAGYNDGILITVAMEERSARIEVGTGLENIIKDEVAAELIREDLAPSFRDHKYGRGLYLVVGKIVGMIEQSREKIGEKPTSRLLLDVKKFAKVDRQLR